jgi:uncharacterized repeat protein (TIGR01451 family)
LRSESLTPWTLGIRSGPQADLFLASAGRETELPRMCVELLEDRKMLTATVAGFDGNTLVRADDNSSNEISLPFTINFYGSSFEDLWVNNNGDVTFTTPLPNTYTPFDLSSDLGTPIIAALLADVDTTGAGLVTYGTGTVEGHLAFGVTWSNVGYYNAHTDKLNTFQLIIIDRPDVATGANGDDFDIELNYDQIQWESGDFSGGLDGLGGTSAAVGFSDGTGSNSFQLAGSEVDGAFLDSNQTTGLIHNDFNSTTPGRYIYDVRNGSVITPVPAPVVTTSGTTDTFGLGGSSVPVDSGVTVASTDADLTGATLTIAPGTLQTGDTLHFTNADGITGRYDATRGVLTLSGTATPAQYQTALQSVTFSTISTNTTARSISVVADDDSVSSTPASETVAVAMAQIAVTGRAQSIGSGSTTPSADNDTQFGSASVDGTPLYKTYTITNDGEVQVNLSSVSLVGSNPYDFVIHSQPESVLQPGQQTTFTVEFAPAAAGARTATISFDENGRPFTFAVGGAATAPVTPDLSISVSDNAGGSSVNSFVGDAKAGQTLSYTVIVSNNGTGDASGVTINDPLPPGFVDATFTVTPAGGASDIDAGGSGDIDDTGVDMPAGSIITYTVTGTIGPKAGASLSNTATVISAAGQAVNASLVTGLDKPEGIAVSGDDLFVANEGNGTIGEYTLAGTPIKPELITGLASSFGIAVSGDDLFVANYKSGMIGEYNTSGGVINATLVTGLIAPSQIAVSGDDLFIADEGNGTIDRYTITSGQAVNSTTLVSGLQGAWAVAVSGSDLFVVDERANTISEYNATSGQLLNPNFITELNGPVGIAVSGNDLFVANSGSGTISEFTTAGTSVNTALVTGLVGPADVVVAGQDVLFTKWSSGSIGEYTTTESATDVDNVKIAPPVVTPSATTNTFILGGSPVAVDSGVTVTSADSDLTGATMTISPSTVQSDDVLNFSNQNGISGSFNATAGVLTLTGSATPDQYQAALQSVMFSTTSTDLTPRSISIVVDDSNDTDSIPSIAAVETVDVAMPPPLISITDNAGSSRNVVSGQQVVYTITVTNASNIELTGVTVSDPLPADISADTFTATTAGDNGKATGFTPSGAGNIADKVDMPPGSSITYVVTASVSSAANGPFTSSVTATALGSTLAQGADTLTGSPRGTIWPPPVPPPTPAPQPVLPPVLALAVVETPNVPAARLAAINSLFNFDPGGGAGTISEARPAWQSFDYAEPEPLYQGASSPEQHVHDVVLALALEVVPEVEGAEFSDERPDPQRLPHLAALELALPELLAPEGELESDSLRSWWIAGSAGAVLSGSLAVLLAPRFLRRRSATKTIRRHQVGQ